MTPKQREMHTENLKAIIDAYDFKEDRYGNYKRTIAGREFRIKFKKVNMRIELKCNSVWVNQRSEVISKITLDGLRKYMSVIFPI